MCVLESTNSQSSIVHMFSSNQDVGLGWVDVVAVLDFTNKSALWKRDSHTRVVKTVLVFAQTTSSCKNFKIFWVGLNC